MCRTIQSNALYILRTEAGPSNRPFRSQGASCDRLREGRVRPGPARPRVAQQGPRVLASTDGEWRQVRSGKFLSRAFQNPLSPGRRHGMAWHGMAWNNGMAGAHPIACVCLWPQEVEVHLGTVHFTVLGCGAVQEGRARPITITCALQTFPNFSFFLSSTVSGRIPARVLRCG